MNTVKPESIAFFYLIPDDVMLAKRLVAMLPVTCSTDEKPLEGGFIPFENGFADTIREAFMNYSALVFIGATGITVRVLAPLVNDKFCDPAAVVIDEYAQHVVSLLSGHAGGADVLTHYLAGILGAGPVTTTMTDVSDMAAPDMLAFQLSARMSDFRSAVKIVNQMLVSSRRVDLWWDDELTQDASHCDRRGFITVTDLNQLPELDASVYITLRANLPDLSVPHWKLVLQRVVAGIGCRRGMPFPLLATLPVWQLEAQQLGLLALKTIGSITLKRGEQGLIQLASCCRAPFEIFTADVLREHEHRLPASLFVRKTVGTGSALGPAVRLLSYGKLSGEIP